MNKDQKDQTPETSTPEKTKTTTSPFDYSQVWAWLEKKGKQQYGTKFQLFPTDQKVINTLLSYFLQDQFSAPLFGVNPSKGILLTGPVGCGKTSLMNLLKFLPPPSARHVMKSCRDISFEFIRDGYEVIHRYSRDKAHKFEPQIFCFDDLGTEKNLKYYGNECNVLAEILLSRYDLFTSRRLLTHVTTNLSASELEAAYGSRLRSRMREMFNLVAFEAHTIDKRK